MVQCWKKNHSDLKTNYYHINRGEETLEVWQSGVEQGWVSCVLNLLPAVPERGNLG